MKTGYQYNQYKYLLAKIKLNEQIQMADRTNPAGTLIKTLGNSSSTH